MIHIYKRTHTYYQSQYLITSTRRHGKACRQHFKIICRKENVI